MAAGSAKRMGLSGLSGLSELLTQELSGLQMGNPDNSASITPSTPNPEVITPGTPLRASTSNPSIIAHLVTLNNSIIPITPHQ